MIYGVKNSFSRMFYEPVNMAVNGCREFGYFFKKCAVIFKICRCNFRIALIIVTTQIRNLAIYGTEQ